MNEGRDPADVAASFARFATVGIGATLIHVAVFALLIGTTPIDPVVATALAFAVAFLFGYALNRRWTFRSSGAWTRELPRYLATQLAGLALSAGIMAAVVHGFGGSPWLGLALGLLLVPPLAYALARLWAFRGAGPDAGPGAG